MKLFLIGGFLGSGKTTAIQQACDVLTKKGTRVGVITNDQGKQLVDTEFIKGFNIPTLEVTEGCFCCNYDKLDSGIDSLIQSHNPEIIFAESVGSCTDLVATVVKPFLKFHPEIEVSVSVFADARVLPVLIKGSRLFVNSVNYIYKKQLEEADVLVVNKIDTLAENQLEEIKQLVKKTYPHKAVLYQNSLDPESIKLWLQTLATSQTTLRQSLELDYDIYGAGEAELAWFDSEVEILSQTGDAVNNANQLVKQIYLKIKEKSTPIGHLKFLIKNGEQQRKISFTSGGEDSFIIPANLFSSPKVSVLINARVQTTPAELKGIIAGAIDEIQKQTGCVVTEKKRAVFKPGYPKPTHRIPNFVG